MPNLHEINKETKISSRYHSSICSQSPTPTIAVSTPMTSTNSSDNNTKFITQAALGNFNVGPTNELINTKAFYDVIFRTVTARKLDRKV
jgi:hypothetical protein